MAKLAKIKHQLPKEYTYKFHRKTKIPNDYSPGIQEKLVTFTLKPEIGRRSGFFQEPQHLRSFQSHYL